MFRHSLPALAIVSLLASSPLAAAQSSASPAPSASTPRTVAKASPSTVVVNINTASASELDALPGIGPKVAARIVEYRQKNGPFKKIEELMNVQGIGEKNFLKLKPQISVTGKQEGTTAIK